MLWYMYYVTYCTFCASPTLCEKYRRTPSLVGVCRSIFLSFLSPSPPPLLPQTGRDRIKIRLWALCAYPHTCLTGGGGGDDNDCGISAILCVSRTSATQWTWPGCWGDDHARSRVKYTASTSTHVLYTGWLIRRHSRYFPGRFHTF